MRTRARRDGFTLIEVLVAVALLTVAMIIVYGTFSAAIRAQRRAEQVLADLRHGGFIMDQLVTALRSTAVLGNAPERCGFWFEDRGAGDEAEDMISWVKTGNAFIAPGSQGIRGPHRLEFTVEPERGVAIRLYSHLADDDQREEVDTVYPSAQVQGFDCRFYSVDEEDWLDEWEQTNRVPKLVEVTLVLKPPRDGEEPIRLRRAVTLPVTEAAPPSVSYREAAQTPPDRGGRGRGRGPATDDQPPTGIQGRVRQNPDTGRGPGNETRGDRRRQP